MRHIRLLLPGLAPMRSASRISALALGAALVLALGAGSVRAEKPTTSPAYFNGDIVYVIPGVSRNVVDVTNPAIATKVANPLYVDGAEGVDHVLGEAIPGMAGYNPWWNVILVIDPDTGELVDEEFTSEAEILAAASLGLVELVDPGILVLCQVVRK